MNNKTQIDIAKALIISAAGGVVELNQEDKEVKQNGLAYKAMIGILNDIMSEYAIDDNVLNQAGEEIKQKIMTRLTPGRK